MKNFFQTNSGNSYDIVTIKDKNFDKLSNYFCFVP